MNRGKIPESQIEGIINEYCKGMSVSQIARLYLKSRQGIYRMLAKNEFSLHTNIRRNIPDECLPELVKLYELGYSTTQICEYVGCTISVVDRQLRLAGIDKRERISSRAVAKQMPAVIDTIEDEDWAATATVQEVIDRMKEMALKNE